MDGPEKKIGMNLYQATSGVTLFWVGGHWFQEKNLGPTLNQVKSGIMSFIGVGFGVGVG